MLRDTYNRTIDYLRISVTDRCNLRCVYCMPAGGIIHKPHSQILSFEQIHRIVHAAACVGIRKVRITGGEPLVRKDLPVLIKKLKAIHGLKEIALTTNGIFLKENAVSLKEAGLDRINVSVDSLLPERYRHITRGGDLASVLRGIESALSIGFSSLKINMVLIKGFNIDEILSFARFTKINSVQVRFIEYMPTDLEYLSSRDLFFSARQAKDICNTLGRLNPVAQAGSGVVKVFRIEGFRGTVGFISPMSEPFCSSCNKLRLTSDGRLRSCLHSSKTVDLKEALERDAAGCQELADLIKEAAALKPEGHNLLNVPLTIDPSTQPPLAALLRIPPHGRNRKVRGALPVGLHSENFSMCQIGG